MPIGGSGTTISFSTLRGEFGGSTGSTPDSLSEFYSTSSYANRGVMPNQRGYPLGSDTLIPASGQISFSNFHASARCVPKSLGFAGAGFYQSAKDTIVYNINDLPFAVGYHVFAGVVIDVNGTSSVNLEDDAGPFYYTNQTWLTTIERNAFGANFWVRFTRTSSTGSGYINGSDPSTGWQQLTTFYTRFVNARAQDALINTAYHIASYTIDIAADSAGTNIVSTSTIELSAYSYITNSYS